MYGRGCFAPIQLSHDFSIALDVWPRVLCSDSTVARSWDILAGQAGPTAGLFVANSAHLRRHMPVVHDVEYRICIARVTEYFVNTIFIKSISFGFIFRLHCFHIFPLGSGSGKRNMSLFCVEVHFLFYVPPRPTYEYYRICGQMLNLRDG
jgi:hypothetical protein